MREEWAHQLILHQKTKDFHSEVKVKNLKEICLGNCRLLYGSERFKFYGISIAFDSRPGTDTNTDIAVCEDEDKKKFGAILTCSQEGSIKLLRTEVSDDPVDAVRAMVDRLQKDTAIIFGKSSISFTPSYQY